MGEADFGRVFLEEGKCIFTQNGAGLGRKVKGKVETKIRLARILTKLDAALLCHKLISVYC